MCPRGCVRLGIVGTFAIDASPLAGSQWPMLDLTDPTSNGSFRLVQNTAASAFDSSGSPAYEQLSLTP